MRLKTLFFAAFLLLAVSSPAFGASSYETEVINHVGIGDISIRLEEFELDGEGKEVPYENNKTVLPGQKVQKIVRIFNEADTAWVRAKLEYVSDAGIQGLSDQMIQLASSQWMKTGEYYYYTVPIERNSSVDFIREVRIPPEWDGKTAGKSFSIIVTVDSVQTDHFTPDFSGEAPWFGTVIEACVHTACEPEAAENRDFSVVFEGGAEGLIRIGDDFFSNWGELMPGDTVTDTVKLKNTYRRPVTIYFRTETVADDRLVKILQLEIKREDRIIYSGSMDGNLDKNVELAFLKYGEEAELTYTLYVPEELNNQYALSKTKTKWIFGAKVKKSGGDGGGSGEDNDGPGDSDADEEASGRTGGSMDSGETCRSVPNQVSGPGNSLSEFGHAVLQEIVLPQTGDSNADLYAFLLMIGSGTGIAILWRRKKREGQDG